MAGTNITQASSPSTATTANVPTTATSPAGLLPTLPTLDQFLGLPAMIDWQDLAIRTGLVVTGIVLVILVAWSFVRGKQAINVTVQTPTGQQEEARPV